MKAMHCDELMKGCDFVARGATEDEVMKKAAEHAKTAHGIDNITPELAQKVKAAIKNEWPIQVQKKFVSPVSGPTWQGGTNTSAPASNRLTLSLL